MRHTILVVSTTRKTIPCLLLQDTRQKAGRIIARDCMESRKRSTKLFTKAWAMSCTGIILCWSFNLVWDHNSGHPKLLKWLTLRIRRSVSGDWITSRLSVLAEYLACNITLVSASSWFERSARTPLHWPLVTVTAFSPCLKLPPITSSFCGGRWSWPSKQEIAQVNLVLERCSTHLWMVTLKGKKCWLPIQIAGNKNLV